MTRVYGMTDGDEIISISLTPFPYSCVYTELEGECESYMEIEDWIPYNGEFKIDNNTYCVNRWEDYDVETLSPIIKTERRKECLEVYLENGEIIRIPLDELRDWDTAASIIGSYENGEITEKYLS